MYVVEIFLYIYNLKDRYREERVISTLKNFMKF